MKNNKQDLFTSLAYQVGEDVSMRELTEAYSDLFSSSNPSAIIVARDLVQFVSHGAEGFNPDVNIQNFTSGLKTVVQHMINSINREVFLDEETGDEEEI